MLVTFFTWHAPLHLLCRCGSKGRGAAPSVVANIQRFAWHRFAYWTPAPTVWPRIDVTCNSNRKVVALCGNVLSCSALVCCLFTVSLKNCSQSSHCRLSLWLETRASCVVDYSCTFPYCCLLLRLTVTVHCVSLPAVSDLAVRCSSREIAQTSFAGAKWRQHRPVRTPLFVFRRLAASNVTFKSFVASAGFTREKKKQCKSLQNQQLARRLPACDLLRSYRALLSKVTRNKRIYFVVICSIERVAAWSCFQRWHDSDARQSLWRLARRSRRLDESAPSRHFCTSK